MKSNIQNSPALTEQAVYEVIASHSDSISRDSLANLFGHSPSDRNLLDVYLQSLIRDKKIIRADDSLTRYSAVNPMSDLVIARVTGVPGRARAQLEIENQKFETHVPVTMANKQARAHRLKYGERVLVVLDRHKGHELRAKFLDRVTRSNQPSLVGKFNGNAQPGYFHALDKRIRTSFAVSGAPGVLDPRTPYYARITPDFDPHNPELFLGEQKWDPKTGNRIYEVIGSNYGLRPRHDRTATLEAKRVNNKIRKLKPANYKAMHRRDLTHIPFMVVDPPGAADHDDAIYIERLPDGFRTIVAIADVAMYVRSGSALDEAARSRGFSHYFPDETFHMLPLQLSTYSCSLLEGKLRPVIYVEQLRDVDGTPYSTDIGLGYIQSQRQMTYPQFQQHLASDEAAPYRDLQRILNLRQYEKEILMESASTDHRYTEAQLIVQAMMIDANKAVAEFLEDKNMLFPYRTHSGHINPEAYDEQVENFYAMGYEIPENIEDLSPAYINGLIGEAALRGDREKEKISSKIRLELLQPALYSTRPLGHWGITADRYCHFTSPIRRYADQLVQRALHDALDDREYGLSDNDIDQMEQTVRILNHLQTISRNIQHDAQKYYAVLDLHRHEGNSMHAHLSGVSSEGIEVTLPVYGLKKTIRANALPPGWGIASNGRGITDRTTYIPHNARIRVTIADVQPHKAQWNIARLEATKGNYVYESERKKMRPAARGVQRAPIVA